MGPEFLPGGEAVLYTITPATGSIQSAQIAVLDLRTGTSNHAAVSPNGRWVAYNSNASGRYEISVERYPELGNRQRISSGGGRAPIWSRNGRELFFSSLDGRQMLAVPVDSGTTFVPGRQQVWFEFAMQVPTAGTRPYDITPDGRFMIIPSAQADAGGTAQNLIVVQNWTEELKRLVPVK